MKGNDVTFIRKNGRLIPIRKKKKKSDKSDNKKAAAKGVGAAATLAASAKVASDKVKKSRPEFSKSARLRGASKLAQKGSKTRNSLIRKSAQAKIKGLRFQSRAGTILGLGSFAASILAGSAAGDALKGRESADEFAGFASSAVPFLGAFAFKKLAKVRFSGNSPKEAFRNIQKFGEKQSRQIVRNAEKSAFKSGRIKKGSQLGFDF